MKPLLYIVERLLVSHVIDDNNTVRSTIIRRSDGSETLLTGGIPDLKLDSLSIKFNCADFLWNATIAKKRIPMSIPRLTTDSTINTESNTHKVNTDGGNVGLGVRIISKSKQQTRFSDAGISNKEKLE